MNNKKKAILLLSSGLDSTTMLAIAIQQDFEIYALTIEYGQRNFLEVNHSKKIAKLYNVKEHKIAKCDLRIFGKSALTDSIDVPKNEYTTNEVPITYVPARNTIFLSFALAYAEVVKAYDIFIGANVIDYSGYPDCRPEYIESFEKTANIATSYVKNNTKLNINTPLMYMTKKDIIHKGLELGVDYSLTFSCYDPDEDGNSCGACDSCLLRIDAFKLNNLKDPIKYAKK